MKSTIFVRPNLKLFLVGAVLFAVVQHLITTVHSQAQSPLRRIPVSAREISDEQLEELIRSSGGNHSPELYVRISRLLEEKGDYRRALLYLRRADRASQADAGAE